MILRLLQLSTATEIDGTNLKELADKRTMTTKSLPAQRGVIYDSRGEVLAQNVASYKLIAYLSSKRTTNKKKPQHVVDKEKTATELAPILGMDKEEIVTIARKIGTMQTAILPYEDCCTVFTPKHPKTKPNLNQLIHAEKNLDREALILQAIENTEKITVKYDDEPYL